MKIVFMETAGVVCLSSAPDVNKIIIIICTYYLNFLRFFSNAYYEYIISNYRRISIQIIIKGHS